MPAPVVPEAEPAGLLSDITLSDLQLHRQPFAELAADDDPFADATTGEQLSDIKQALITGDDLLLVLGDAGAGKSTLLAQLGANSGLRIQCFAVRGSDRFSTHNLFTGMLEAFKLPPPDDLKDMLDALVPCLHNMVGNNILSAVVLDNADSVTDGELTRLLSGMLYLNSQDDTLLRIVLAADPSFEDRIPELLPEGADLPYSSLSIEPLDDQRAGAYLAHRLQQAGWMDALPFSEEETLDINARAGGRPRSLHQEAAGVLETRSRGMGAAMPDPFGPDADIASAAPRARRAGAARKPGGGRGRQLALGAVALALIGGGLWLSAPRDRAEQPQRYTTLEQRPVESDATDLTLVDAGRSAVQAPDATDSAQDERTGATTRTRQPGQDPVAPVAAPAVVPESDPAPAPEPSTEPVPAQQAELPNEPVAPSDDELLEPQATERNEPAPEPVAAPDPIDTATPSNAVADTLADGQAANVGTPGLEPPTWILLQDADRFTVQMSASTDRASVENFLRRAELAGPNSIFAFDRDGATWYALVHGLYASIDEARAAVERMPAQAQSNQPWIRAVGRIQAVLREQN